MRGRRASESRVPSQTREADRRAHLDLQVNLLAEQGTAAVNSPSPRGDHPVVADRRLRFTRRLSASARHT